jgi:hypothetical protein
VPVREAWTGSQRRPYPSNRATTQAGTNTKLKALQYPGMEAVPMLLFNPTGWDCYAESGPSGDDRIQHICSTPSFKNFSIEELRLKQMVSQAASN